MARFFPAAVFQNHFPRRLPGKSVPSCFTDIHILQQICMQADCILRILRIQADDPAIPCVQAD